MIRLSAALAPHRILTGVSARDQFEVIDMLFDAVHRDFGEHETSWRKAKVDVIKMERRIPGVFHSGLAFLEPLGNQGAPGSSWLPAVACAPEGVPFKFKSRSWQPPLAHLMVLNLNPPEPKGGYLTHLREVSRLAVRAEALGRAPTPDAFMGELIALESSRSESGL